jgi:DNA-directed RNA polymerase I, II, and III subunit RPABC1
MKISREQFRQRFADRETGEAEYVVTYLGSVLLLLQVVSTDNFRSRRLMRLSASPTEEMNLLHTPLPSKANPNPQTTAGTIWVEFSPETTIGIKHLRQFAHHLDQQKYTTGIFITIGPVTTAAMRAFEPLSQVGITAEHFQESDLLVNITRHELVPRHVLLSAEEKKVLLQRYRLKETQLPRIQHSDPVSRYLGLKRGNVVKIIRKSETAGRYASYRWVF